MRGGGRASRATSSPTAMPADHIAFWLGDGRILHATGRENGLGVVEEPEPADLRARRRRLIRL